MEWLYPYVGRAIAAAALIYFGLGLFNVNWLLRVRILAAMASGALLVAAIGWNMVRPEDPLGAVTAFGGQITITEGVVLIALGIAAAVVATIVCYPIGRFIAPVAAATGVAILALCGGNLRQLLLTHHTLADRNELYGFLRWEMLFWLAVCAAGYLACIVTSKLLGIKVALFAEQPDNNQGIQKWGNLAVAAIIGAVIVHFTIGIFAQDIRRVDETLGSVVGQPGGRQIAFGVFVSVALAAYIVRHFTKVHYLPVVLGAAGYYFVTLSKFVDSDKLQYMVKAWPVDFYPHSIYAILPAQFISFAVLGAASGYWMSYYFDVSKKSELSDKAK